MVLFAAQSPTLIDSRSYVYSRRLYEWSLDAPTTCLIAHVLSSQIAIKSCPCTYCKLSVGFLSRIREGSMAAFHRSVHMLTAFVAPYGPLPVSLLSPPPSPSCTVPRCKDPQKHVQQRKIVCNASQTLRQTRACQRICLSTVRRDTDVQKQRPCC